MSLFSSSFQMIVSKSSDNGRASLSSLSRLHGTLTPKIVATISLAIAGIVTSVASKKGVNELQIRWSPFSCEEDEKLDVEIFYSLSQLWLVT